MSYECLSLSPWFWMSRNFLLEMRGGGQTTKSTYTKGEVHIKRTCAYEGEGGSHVSHFGAYVLNE